MNIFRKILFSILMVTMLSSTIGSNVAHAEMDARIKALGSMAAYGTVGGALLGTASLAFDAPGRSVAIGASIGLYLGLIFGSYVVLSHMYRNRVGTSGDDYYPEAGSSPYDGGAPPPERWNSQYLDDQMMIKRQKVHQNKWEQKQQMDVPLFYLNVINYRF